jgi:hypothetical protein
VAELALKDLTCPLRSEHTTQTSEKTRHVELEDQQQKTNEMAQNLDGVLDLIRERLDRAHRDAAIQSKSIHDEAACEGDLMSWRGLGRVVAVAVALGQEGNHHCKKRKMKKHGASKKRTLSVALGAQSARVN